MRPGVLLGACLLAGCVVSPPVAENPYPSPPPLRAETLPLPPVSAEPLIWQPGHWDFAGGSYLWREGRYVLRAGHGSLWQDGHWTRAGDAWQWIPAHWTGDPYQPTEE